MLWRAVETNGITEARKFLVWVVLAALAALVAYVGIRGYLSPELLFNFANSFYC